MTALQSNSPTALNFNSPMTLKKYLAKPDNTERLSKCTKTSSYEGEGILISSAFNCISTKAAQSLERITIVSESLKELLSESCVRILNSGRIKIIRRTGYCGGAARLFINEYFQAMKKK